jgi:hypothetical protein
LCTLTVKDSFVGSCHPLICSASSVEGMGPREATEGKQVPDVFLIRITR